AAEQKRGEQRIENRVACEREEAWTRRHEERGEHADVGGNKGRAEPCGGGDQRERRERWNEARGELRLPEHDHGRALQLMEQDRFVEEGLFVVERRPPVSALDHLARRLRVMRLVRIPKRSSAETPEQDDEHDRPDGAPATKITSAC